MAVNAPVNTADDSFWDELFSAAATFEADAAKSSQLNPLSRATILGEKQLPGKSVFDFLSISARDRLAAATGKADLPEAKGEIPEGYALSEEEKRYFRALLAWKPSDAEGLTKKRAAPERPLAGHFRVLILGSKGCGKTAILTRVSV